MKYVIAAIAALLATASTKYIDENKGGIIEVSADFDDALIELSTTTDAEYAQFKVRHAARVLVNKDDKSAKPASTAPIAPKDGSQRLSDSELLKKVEAIHANNQVATEKAYKEVDAVYYSGWQRDVASE